jgi:hypothetical protein
MNQNSNLIYILIDFKSRMYSSTWVRMMHKFELLFAHINVTTTSHALPLFFIIVVA